MHHNVTNQLAFEPIDTEEVEKLILRVKANDFRLNNINVKMLLKKMPYCKETKTDIINHLLLYCEVPQCWKKSIIIPYLKQAKLNL